MSAKGASPRRKGRGEFFAVDRRCWGAVCGLAGDVPPEYAAAAYLVLACFSDGSNTISTASANAVEKYADLTPGRATKAIKALVDAGAVEALPVEGSAKAGPRVPRHRLRPWSEFREVLARRYGDQLRRLRGSPRITSPLRCAATELVQAGLALPTGLDGEGNPVALEVEPEGDGSPDWVWLPNALVRGAGRGTPPVERARRTARVDNLRVLVELYAEHDLSEDGGVSRETWRETYRRAGPAHAIGGHPIYGFVSDGRWSTNAKVYWALGRERYWDAIRWVRSAGLASHVLLVTESGRTDAQPLYPLEHFEVLPSGDLCYATKGNEGTGAVRAAMVDALERIDPLRVARTAIEAELGQHPEHIIIADKTYPEVALVGVLRLRYRPRTTKTSRWFAHEGRALARLHGELERIGRPQGELAALSSGGGIARQRAS